MKQQLRFLNRHIGEWLVKEEISLKERSYLILKNRDEYRLCIYTTVDDCYTEIDGSNNQNELHELMMKKVIHENDEEEMLSMAIGFAS